MNNFEESPSRMAKLFGFKSLVEVSKITGESEQTLINWAQNKRYQRRFIIVLKGALAEKTAMAYREKIMGKSNDS